MDIGTSGPRLQRLLNLSCFSKLEENTLIAGYGNFLSSLKDMYNSKGMIFNLAKNDFKTKYVGSLLGTLWAFIRPVITVLVYWFVFQVGLHSDDVNGYPFVLWLMTGLVPWFYFSEALAGGTSSLLEYQFLVKKIVFNVATIPLVKVISALFPHVFFTGVTLIIYCCFGNLPHIYMIQLLYYMLCMVVFMLALVYFTSSVVLFFKDTIQIIGVVLEIGIWMTPIMWQLSWIPEQFRMIFKLNPMYYIVFGYRDSVISRVWFWEHPVLTIYFWVITLILFVFGARVFNKLKIHFADVL